MKRYNLTAADLRSLARSTARCRFTRPSFTRPSTLGLLAALLSAVYWRRTRDGQVICTLL